MTKESKLEKLIRYHKSLYYQGCPEISDSDFDQLENELRLINKDNPVLFLVGSAVKGKKIKHLKKMLSLDKTYSIEDLIHWVNVGQVCATYKIDGNSCSLVYNNGILNHAKTRGDGQYGENITQTVSWIENINLTSTDKLFLSATQVEIRGELYCDDENFLKLSDEMAERKLERPSSARNIVAGILGRKDHIDLAKYIKFMAYDCDFNLENEDVYYTNEENKFKFLNKIGFETPKYSLAKNETEIKNIVKDSYNFYNDGNYLIDGIVFTYNQFSLHLELGFTAHHPKFKIAFKFKSESKETKINEITWSVSRNGILTPVAKIEPVELSGAVISNVTLHNWGIVHSNNLKIGDKIEIVRSGEVIPKYLRTIKESNENHIYPTRCPSCGNETIIDGIWLKCLNIDCEVKILEEILHFLKNIGVEDFSKKRLAQLIGNNKVKNISDIYKLKIDDFLDLKMFKNKLATKVINSISNSKKTTLVKFLASLGLKGVGVNKCQFIINSGFNTIEKIINLNFDQLVNIEGFADISANDFLGSINEKKDLILNLIQLGFSIDDTRSNESILDKLNFCITGKLTRSRPEIANIIRDNGGVVKSAVTKDLSFLITNDLTVQSSKLKSAQKLNIPIISEDQFFSKWNF